ncbi:type IV pilus assembly protein PilF [Marinobacter persicus]|uniref:Type IV pilus assembly protein PilF n=2 Tax=Marinobacter persicus TaxID=930118 RepID=A0A1I3WW54_9GAMM|nr:hypothetical protein GCM10008110_15790 [Marinobacter persicus]SFK11147.1 type IV pilus assembly protein PilF [Marinobacter persicus]
MKLTGFIGVALALMVSGCVTTTDSRFAREADRDKALENYVKLATAYIGQGNLGRAEHHLDRALEIDGNYAPALAAEGLVYSSDGEQELAERSFRKALSEDSGYTRGRTYYGAFLYSQRRFEEARDQFSMASRDTEYEDRGSVFFNLGMTEERLGNLQEAEDAFRRAVELTRGEPRSLLSLSRVLVEQRDYSGASRYYSRLQSVISGSTRHSHSPESLLIGVKIARHFGDQDQEASMAMMLKNEFPESVEYQQYKVLIANER